MPYLRFGDRRIFLPRNRVVRIIIGVLLILGGFLAILPIFGMWMIPAGLIVLSVDIPIVRRWRRRSTVRLVLAWRKFRTGLHRRFGVGQPVLRRKRRRKTRDAGLRGAG